MLVRQYVGDRAHEKLATYQIEVVGRKPFDPLPPSTDAEVAHGIRATLHAVNGLGRLHHYVKPGLGDSVNGFVRLNSDDFGADISSIDNLYLIGTYEIEEDEALVVEVERLDVRYWNFAIENPWHESVDYMKRKTSRTHDDVTVDADGKVRFVIAHARTDHPNYLETAGHRRGFMTFRWVGERDTKAPPPKVTEAQDCRSGRARSARWEVGHEGLQGGPSDASSSALADDRLPVHQPGAGARDRRFVGADGRAEDRLVGRERRHAGRDAAGRVGQRRTRCAIVGRGEDGQVVTGAAPVRVTRGEPANRRSQRSRAEANATRYAQGVRLRCRASRSGSS